MGITRIKRVVRYNQKTDFIFLIEISWWFSWQKYCIVPKSLLKPYVIGSGAMLYSNMYKYVIQDSNKKFTIISVMSLKTSFPLLSKTIKKIIIKKKTFCIQSMEFSSSHTLASNAIYGNIWNVFPYMFY